MAQLYLESQESIATDRQSRSHVIVLWPRRVDGWHRGDGCHHPGCFPLWVSGLQMEMKTIETKLVLMRC